MKVLIAGAGAVGRSIARELVDNSHEVTPIERNPGHFDADEIPAADWIFGNACESRMRGEGRMEGSVHGGGILRESVMVVPAK